MALQISQVEQSLTAVGSAYLVALQLSQVEQPLTTIVSAYLVADSNPFATVGLSIRRWQLKDSTTSPTSAPYFIIRFRVRVGKPVLIRTYHSDPRGLWPLSIFPCAPQCH